MEIFSQKQILNNVLKSLKSEVNRSKINLLCCINDAYADKMIALMFLLM